MPGQLLEIISHKNRAFKSVRKKKTLWGGNPPPFVRRGLIDNDGVHSEPEKKIKHPELTLAILHSTLLILCLFPLNYDDVYFVY